MKILHLDSNHPVLAEKLEEAGYENTFDFSCSREDLLATIMDYDAIGIRSRLTMDDKMLGKASKLKCIGRVGAGLENIDLDFAHKQGIECLNAPEGNRNAVAEHTLGMLLSLMNKLNSADKEVRTGVWKREQNRGIELAGRTVGIIGFGNMGQSFARKLQSMDCQKLYYDIDETIDSDLAQRVTLSELQSQSDVISLHTPHTELTKGMINKEFIKGCRDHFILLNTARGSAVIIEDLVAALESGKVRAAGMDVLEYEKNSFEDMFKDGAVSDTFQKLIKFPNVLLTPHVAGWTVESKKRLAEVTADKIIACLSSRD